MSINYNELKYRLKLYISPEYHRFLNFDFIIKERKLVGTSDEGLPIYKYTTPFVNIFLDDEGRYMDVHPHG